MEVGRENVYHLVLIVLLISLNICFWGRREEMIDMTRACRKEKSPETGIVGKVSEKRG